MDDRRIVELYLSRDESAIEHTRQKYGARLLALSESITQNTSDAEECVGDTYFKAWSSIPPNKPFGYLFAYLAKIARNLSLNRLKKTGADRKMLTELTEEMEECIPSPDNTECRINDGEFGELINTFLRELDEDTRNIFLRRYWFCDSIKVIALRFSLGEGAVKSSLFRTRKRLKEFILKEGIVL